MASPTTRAEFKEYCLRRLGKPVIDINVDDDQIEDRIDDSQKFWFDYHFEGTEKMYYKHQLIADDVTNKYITLPDNIIGAVNIFPVGTSLSTTNIFNIRYQISLNDLYDLTNVTMVPYYQAMQHIQFLEQMLVGQQPLRYNRHSNRLYIDMDWNILNLGEYIVVEAYQIVDPEVYTSAWGDRLLQKYATALIKRQWGENLIKYRNVPLPGGQQFNADKIYDDAVKEIEEIEQTIISSYSLPSTLWIG